MTPDVPEVPDALDACLSLSQACARLQLRLEDDLGAFHGLDFPDFTLLYRLGHAPDGRLPLTELAPALGLKLSALTRKLIQLEKVGLAVREGGAGGDGRRQACIRPAGKRLMQEAEVTARAVCTVALGRGPEADLTSQALQQLQGCLRG